MFFFRMELVKKILIPENTIVESSNLIFDDCNVDHLEASSNIFDLRGISNVDEFGAMSLICLFKKRLYFAEQKVLILVKNSISCRYLKSIGFFDELKRGSSNLFINDEEIEGGTLLPPENILRLTSLGYKGAEKKILEQLYSNLQDQGFSENLCSRLGWALGELADNAHTHAGSPCFMTIVGRPAKPKEPKFLCISIGDIGDGISGTLKTNPKYQNLSDLEALCLSFKSTVTSWDDIAERGKGLNDLLAIGKGNQAWVRVECNGISLFFDFGKIPFETKVREASTKTAGTRFSLVLIDANFIDVSRAEIDLMIEKIMREQI
ncbi:MAG: hypothetical protein HQM16_16595 [Deltaproteobacteria bacterium]|nr:hypothetical protein [Deltaproteobacteria bacterium]